jgi:hypothetical protein
MDDEEQSADELRELLGRLLNIAEWDCPFEYQPHVGGRTQKIYFEPAGTEQDGDWVAWTRFAEADGEEVAELVRRAARESAGLSFREVDGEIRARVLLESETPIEVQARLVEHLGEVADRLEFRLSDGEDAF